MFRFIFAGIFVFLLTPVLAHAADYTGEKWVTIEIPLTSTRTYAKPIEDVTIQAVFSKPNTTSVTRRAFWDGNSTWRVRFAAPETGTWTMVTTSLDATNGMHNITKIVQINPYSGNLPIYTHGLLKVSPDRHYFTYADGTPFFYLGDTHWLVLGEKWAECNYPGCTSQFKFQVDHRVKQNFTVYQTEWLGPTHVECALNQTEIATFQGIDQKINYLASNGLVTTITVEWRDLAPKCTDAYLQKLGQYWAARYGSYPVLWTVAQEVDGLYPQLNDPPNLNTKWQVVGQALKEVDGTYHPLTAHMVNENYVNASTSTWKNLSYHDWFGAQIQGTLSTALAASYYATNKPTIYFEGPYENYWIDRAGNRNHAYTAFLSGWLGYGYGVAGVWDNHYTCPTTDTACKTWSDGLLRESGYDMQRLHNFFRTLSWWKFVPRFDDTTWGVFTSPSFTRLATDNSNQYLAYFWGSGNTSGTLKNLSDTSTYSATWFDPRTGRFSPISRSVRSSGGQWTVPVRPTSEDYVLVLTNLVSYDYRPWLLSFAKNVNNDPSLGEFNGDGYTNSFDYATWIQSH